MFDPALGPLLFDTSAESWLGRTQSFEALSWMRRHLSHHEVNVSAVTVMERVLGYSLLWQGAYAAKRGHIKDTMATYLAKLRPIRAFDGTIAVLAPVDMAPDPKS